MTFTEIVMMGVIAYLLGINGCAYVAMYIDKKRAIRMDEKNSKGKKQRSKNSKKGYQRVPERTLFLLVILGGGVGGTIGMHQFRHKTKHWYFKYGFPMIVLVQIVVLMTLVRVLR